MKKRWKGLVIWVWILVLLSMLVPLVFLLGVHTGFYSSSGYGGEHKNRVPSKLTMYEPQHDYFHPSNQSKETKSEHIEELIQELGTTSTKGNSTDQLNNKTNGHSILVPVQRKEQETKANGAKLKDTVKSTGSSLNGTSESLNYCEIRFGSYCLWRQEHKENMNDTIVRKMKDLLFVARAYYPSIAKMPKLDKFTHDMKINIQDFERVFSETTTDKDLPSEIEKKLNQMESVTRKAKSYPVECSNVDKKFRQLVVLTEDEASFHMKQSAFLYQLSVQTMPKSLHCLSMRLTVEHFVQSSLDMTESLNSDRHKNPELQHYVMFSNHVLASTVAINSTVMHAKESKNQVFHILTDRENFFAMKLWFLRNKFKEAVVEVLNIEELGLADPSHLSVPEEYRISINKMDKLSGVSSTTEYISVFSHMHHLLPVIFPSLKKMIILDDDVVVQRDLSFLWSLNMEGKVNGAVQECNVKLSQLVKYLGDEKPVEDSCAWTSGLNVVDLERWREQGLSKTYQRLVNKMHDKEELSKTATLGAGFLTFQGEIFPLDNNLVVSGLGYNYGLDLETIEKAAVLHFNGNMKPWLDLGIRKYSRFWNRYLDKDNLLLRDCNVNTVK